MKKIFNKKVFSVLLAVMLLATLSAPAFATGDGQVSVTIRSSTFNMTTHTFSYTNLATFNYEFDNGETVKDMINSKYPNNPVWSGSYLHELTFNNTTYASHAYEPTAGSFDEWDEYVGGDPLITYLNTLSDFADADEVYMSCEGMFGSDWAGYYLMGDMYHMCSITYDWIYQVDYDDDPDIGFVYPPNLTSLGAPGTMETMDEYVLQDGDDILITYGLVWVVFDPN